MLAKRVVVRALIPAAVVIVEKSKDLKCRPSELPIYTSDGPVQVKHVERPPPTYVEQQIGNVRRQLFSLAHEVTALEDKAVDLYDNAYSQVEWLINYLGEEDNTTPKYGAIAVGGLAGFILALRGGKFRKLVFTSAGALGMAAICYPKEAAEYSKLVKEEAVRYAKIGYNFYHGVKAEDPPLELPTLPKMPRSLSEIVAIFSTSNQSDSVVGDGKEIKKEEEEVKKTAASSAEKK